MNTAMAPPSRALAPAAVLPAQHIERFYSRSSRITAGPPPRQARGHLTWTEEMNAFAADSEVEPPQGQRQE